MTEGGIASWKLKEGDTFTTGDVLVEIETDKATIDVEAQDDGVLAKIMVSGPRGGGGGRGGGGPARFRKLSGMAWEGWNAEDDAGRDKLWSRYRGT